MNILSVESSCDETAVAIVRDGREVLTDCIASQVDLHRLYGGVVPEIASRKHIEAIYGLADQALINTGLTRDDIDAVAVTYAPGLIGAVLVGVNFAKAAAFAMDKPLIPVHHIRGHIAANYLAYPDLEPPFLCLVVSGGHTMIVNVLDYTKMEILVPPWTMRQGSASIRWPGFWECPIPAVRPWTKWPRPAMSIPTACPAASLVRIPTI